MRIFAYLFMGDRGHVLGCFMRLLFKINFCIFVFLCVLVMFLSGSCATFPQSVSASARPLLPIPCCHLTQESPLLSSATASTSLTIWQYVYFILSGSTLNQTWYGVLFFRYCSAFCFVSVISLCQSAFLGPKLGKL